MNYRVNVNISNKEGNVKGFANVVFGDSFKVTNIAILENKETGQLFVAMPRYKSSEMDEKGENIYKDICNPITKEFREELYQEILAEYQRVKTAGRPAHEKAEIVPPAFSVKVTPFERENSNIRGLARIYIEDCFIINNVNLLQGKEKIFVSMPSYKTNQKDENGKDKYQDICYPVTKEFREKLYREIEETYETELAKRQESGRENGQNLGGRGFLEVSDEPLPFR